MKKKMQISLILIIKKERIDLDCYFLSKNIFHLHIVRFAKISFNSTFTRLIFYILKIELDEFCHFAISVVRFVNLTGHVIPCDLSSKDSPPGDENY